MAPMFAILFCFSLLACARVAAPGPGAVDADATTFVTPDGMVVQMPPVNLRQGNTGGESGGSGGRN